MCLRIPSCRALAEQDCQIRGLGKTAWARSGIGVQEPVYGVGLNQLVISLVCIFVFWTFSRPALYMVAVHSGRMGQGQGRVGSGHIVSG